MRRNKLLSVSAALLCVLMTALMVPQSIHAVEVDNNSLTIKFVAEDKVMDGVEFRLYRVATIDKEKLTATPIAPYDGYNILSGNAEWRVKANTLAGYVSRDRLEPTVAKTTDENGVVRFNGLLDGMYLIVGQSKRSGGYTYTPVPSLLFLPNTSDYYNWSDDVAIEPKFSRRGGSDPDPTGRNIRALKVWDDDGHEDERPGSITVDLLQNGEVIDTVELNADNNWRFDWSGLDRQAEYQVVENNVGDNYIISIEEGGITFVITNTWADPTIIDDPDTPLIDRPDLPDDPEGRGEGDGEIEIGDGDVPLDDLPYTGQLWWPVPVMAGLGMILLALGASLRRRELANEE